LSSWVFKSCEMSCKTVECDEYDELDDEHDIGSHCRAFAALR